MTIGMFPNDGNRGWGTDMAFCTLVEWDKGFDVAQFDAMIEGAGGHQRLPDGCLIRIVGASEAGARVIEVWASPADAQRFAEQSAPTLAGAAIPAPDRVAGFEADVYGV